MLLQLEQSSLRRLFRKGSLLFKQKRPNRSEVVSLVIVAFGVVLGLPLLTGLALQHITSAHSVVFIGLLPLATAVFGVLRGGDRPRTAFWIFSVFGATLVSGFALTRGAEMSPVGDLLMLAAIIVCGLGYAEGAKVSRSLGGWQVISWALVIALPVMIIWAIVTRPLFFTQIGVPGWLSLTYVSLFSMLIGLIFWYRGLALGGIAGVGQLQLLKPFFGLGLSALLLHDKVSPIMIVVTIGVVFCVAGAKQFVKVATVPTILNEA